MDSTITEGYENPDNDVPDVNKQVEYSTNTLHFTQDNFAPNAPMATDSFHMSGDPYPIQQPSEAVYNPVESVQHIEFENQDQHNLENITSQGYYSNTETQYQSYIQDPSQESDNVHKNNGINDINSERQSENTDTQNAVSEQYLDNNSGVVEGTTNLIQQLANSGNDNSIKVEHESISQFDEISENRNDDRDTDDQNLESQKETEENQNSFEQLVENSRKNEGVKEGVLNSQNKTVKKSNVIEEVIENPEPVAVESETHPPEFTELQTYVEYTVEEGSTSQKALEERAEETPKEEVIETQENIQEHQETVEKKQRRTRKPIHDLPMHLLGHDINKPVDPVPNGRALPKPRLGVKVPCRNLTSQIVSKAELEEEIIERSRAKELASNKGDAKFARSLTQRLANKIAPEKVRKDKDKKRKENKTEESVQKEVKTTETVINEISQGASNSAVVNESKIQNDDDLLAILEGEGEEEMPVLTKETSENQVDDSNLKLLEREIALQQLQELPLQEPKERVMKPRFPKTAPKQDLSKSKSEKSNSTNSTSLTFKSSPQSVSAHSSPKPIPVSPKKSPAIDLDVPNPVKKQVELEPQVKVNMILKTYSRKRKPSDVPEFEMPSPKRLSLEELEPVLLGNENSKLDPLALPTDVYVTKSSRVIKKKVIWDPDDEQTIRSLKAAAPKTVEISKTPIPKSSKPVEKMLSEKSVERPKPEQKIVKSAEKNNEKVYVKKIVNKKSPVNKVKRGLSEVDRLLMDEGAVKMLYELKGDDSTSGKRKKDVYSVEKAEKEIIKKANLLKNDLVQNTSNESPKSLRKKEGLALISPPAKPTPILERKMSKDSAKSSIHSPPRSPTLFSSQNSMLVRRRSSSSISSDDMDEAFSPKLRKYDSSKSKKQKKYLSSSDDKKASKETLKTPAPKDTVGKPLKGVQYKSFTMKKSGKHVAIDLNYIDDKCYFSIQVLEELVSAFKKLEKDKECNVVSLTSTSKAFCLGLDYTSLVANKDNDMIDKANELSQAVRKFLLSLLHFPKILVAGIQGECVGLGVTMLTLFDSVIASDTATFRTPYANLGCLGEATFLLTYPNLSNNGLAAELLYANQTLKADEACRRGLISKLCWPEKYKDTLNNFFSSISKGSRQCLEITKKQLRANLKKEIEAAIDSEMDILVEHWTSSECQENFSKIEN